MSAPDFKTLCELAGGSSVATNQDEVDSAMAVRNARLELERRLSPAVMRVVWEALEEANQFLSSAPEGIVPFVRPLVIAKLTRAISLLNGTTPTDKKDE